MGTIVVLSYPGSGDSEILSEWKARPRTLRVLRCNLYKNRHFRDYAMSFRSREMRFWSVLRSHPRPLQRNS